MNLFSGRGFIVYAASSISAFMSGLLPFLILLSAAAFAGASDEWAHLFELALGIWGLCFLLPLVLVASRLKFAPWFAIVGSSVMVLYCAYALLIVIRQGHSNPLTVGRVAIPIWLWVAVPIPFNLVQAAVSFRRFQELRTPSR
jgi:hypothetical protein